MAEAFIGLGSNLQQPWQQLDDALIALAELPLTHVAAVSQRYRTRPIGPGDQPDYLNAVVRIETELPPMVLLEELQRIENGQGRQRSQHWGPRTLDLDLLLFDELHLETVALTIPHPRLHLRDFVLQPLIELAPNLIIYRGKTAHECLSELTEHSILGVADAPLEQPAL